jgi:UDP-N-acetylglucosamine--N-acetylmuramyl-(pentapeptide) pyrophosphoryl-undecaprenol N-acetylglucosamine transferase
MPRKSVLILAGGTGGHVYPALAVASYLRQHAVQVTWLGTAQGIEAKLVPAQGFHLITIGVSGLRGRGLWRWMMAPFMILAAVVRAMRVILMIRPDAVLGMGGFASGPGGLAAWLAGIPLYIHEQNSLPGLTNRLLAPLARTVMQGFPGTFKTGNSVRTTGNPVRADLTTIPEPETRLRGRQHGTLRLLVIGGSQGARVFNELLPRALARLDQNTALDVWHQTGERNFAAARDNYSAVLPAAPVRLVAYIDDMAAAYTWADIVLCRAGALTLAEICVVGIASILVPYPHAVDDHQTANARFLCAHGGALLLPETELEESKLAAILAEFAQARDRLLHMAQAARHIAMPDATRTVSDICMEGIYA